MINLLSSKDRLLARLAAHALAAIGESTVDALIEALRSPDPGVRIEAARALAELDHPDTIAPLFHALEDHSALVVHLAEGGLDRKGVGMSFFHP